MTTEHNNGPPEAGMTGRPVPAGHDGGASSGVNVSWPTALIADRRRSWKRLLLWQVFNAADDVIPDYGSYLFLVPAFECPDELRMLPHRFLVRPTGLGPARKRPPQ